VDERVEDKPRRKRYMSPAHKKKAAISLAKARKVKKERAQQRRKAEEFPEEDVKNLPGEGAVEILRRMVMILCSRFADGRMDKRTCLMCEMRVPPNSGPEYKNPCPCQDAWRYVAYIDRRDQKAANAEG
tara:strand:- start:410 stop:796 length:387 start_codon:yes stop_codon:yes gene_type:complete